MSRVEEAKQILKDNGYYVDNLWCAEDVLSNYSCTDDEAQEILDQALTNNATIEQIWYAISFHAEEIGLIKREEQ